MKNKIVKKNPFLLLKHSRPFFAFVFLIAGFLIFGNIKNVSAGDCCYLHPPNGVNSCDQGVASKSACEQLCADANSTEKLCTWTEKPNTAGESTLLTKSEDLGTGPGIIGNYVLDAFKWLLYGVFVFISYLLGAAGVLFSWVVKTDNVKAVLDNTAIYESWKMVRDMLNLAFILVLLFSAFCTIFQVDKYHLKNILLRLVIMALLVNFSFPISRFIIDASNVIFYFILNTMLSGQGGDSITADFANYSKIVDMLKPESVPDRDFSYIIAIIVFTFILMITMLVIAVMFVIRLVALGILIIFSPIGFVAAIFPSTKHYADDWWGNLFKYSFFAPLMIFMMAIALNILAVMNNNQDMGTSFLNESSKNSTAANASWLANMALFTIPIVILWAGLITAQKLSIAGAGVVTNQAKKFAGWAGRLPWRGVKGGLRATGVSGGVKQTYDYYRKRGIPIGGRRFFGTEQREEKEAWVAGKIPGGAPVREDYERKKAAAIRKEWKDQGGISEAEIESALAGKDRIRARAAAMEAAENVGFGKPEVALKNYKNAAAAVTSDPLLKNIFNDKVKEKNIKLKIESDTEGTIAERYDKHLADLTPEQIAKQKDIHDDENFHNYVRSNIQPHSYTHQQIFSKLKGEDRKKWVTAGLAPGGGKTAASETGTRRPLEETLREQAQRNQEEINRQFPRGT